MPTAIMIGVSVAANTGGGELRPPVGYLFEVDDDDRLVIDDYGNFVLTPIAD